MRWPDTGEDDFARHVSAVTTALALHEGDPVPRPMARAIENLTVMVAARHGEYVTKGELQQALGELLSLHLIQPAPGRIGEAIDALMRDQDRGRSPVLELDEWEDDDEE